jgi:hypothetical protein
VRIVAEKDEAAVDLGVDVAEGERRHRDRKRSGTPVTQDPDPAGRQPIQAGRRRTRLQCRQRSLLKFKKRFFERLVKFQEVIDK